MVYVVIGYVCIALIFGAVLTLGNRRFEKEHGESVPDPWIGLATILWPVTILGHVILLVVQRRAQKRELREIETLIREHLESVTEGDENEVIVNPTKKDLEDFWEER